MPRNTTKFNAELWYAGPSPATGFHFSANGTGPGTAPTGVVDQSLVEELYRVQPMSIDASTPREDVFQFGALAALDRLALESPTVTLDLEYYGSSFVNERLLGFTISSGASETTCISGFLSKATDEKNLFAKIVGEGSDAISNATNNYAVVGLGNMSVVGYQAQGAVGSFPTVTVSFEGQNLKTDLVSSAAGVTGNIIPAVNAAGNLINNQRYALPTGTLSAGEHPLDISVLLPGDINFAITTYQEGQVVFDDLKIQDYNLGVTLSRTALERLGSRTAFSREIDTPITATLQVNAFVGDYATGSISETIKKNTPYDISVTLNKPAYSYGVDHGDGGQPAIKYTLKRAFLDSQSYTMDIAGQKSVTLNFASTLSGPQDTSRGLFFSGVN